jgi:hypothetical protein
MAFDPFEGKVIRSYSAPVAPAQIDRKAQRLREDAVQIAADRSGWCWLLPILGIGVWLVARLVIRRLAWNEKELRIEDWIFALSKVVEWAAVVLMLLAAWFLLWAIWDWWKLRSGRVLWRIGFGLPLNLLSSLLTAQIVCMEFNFDLWRRIEYLVRGW